MPQQLSSSARSDGHSSISFINSLNEATSNATSKQANQAPAQTEAQNLNKTAVKSSDAKSSQDSSNFRRKKSDDDASQDAQPATDTNNLQAQLVIVPQVQPLPTAQSYKIDAQPLTVSANVSADARQSNNADFSLASNQVPIADQLVQPKTDDASVVEGTNADSVPAASDIQASTSAPAEVSPDAPNAKPIKQSVDATPVASDVQASASAPAEVSPDAPAAMPIKQSADVAPVETAAQPAAPATETTASAALAAQPTADQLAIQNSTDQNATAAQVNAVAAAQPVSISQVKTSTTGSAHAIDQLQTASTFKAQPSANVASKLNAKASAKDSANTKSSDGTKLADQDSQNAVDVKASSDQHDSQSNTQQDQDQAPVQVNFAVHTANALANHQDSSSAIAMQAAPAAQSITSDHSPAAPERTVAQPVVATEIQPTINTAKLIQSIGQTEMRVGMRSAEFGNISIHTAASQNSLTAQISLDHSELAQTLTAHLPEMHARIGGEQNIDVRISTNGQSSSFDSANSSSDSRGNDRQQNQNNSFNTSRFFNAEQSQISPVIASASNSFSNNGRLDIRA